MCIRDRSQTVGHVKAVDGVTFNLRRGCTMGLVGESGCGKSTTGRTILRLGGEKTGGQVLFNGKEVYDMTPAEMRELRTKMQIIFQDPFSSLSPRLPVGEIIGEAVREHNLVPKNEFNDYIDQVMDDCGLQPYHKTRYPHELDVYKRQTVGVVGESGCGKSVTSLSLMQLLQRPQGQIVEGAIRLNLGNDKAYDIAKTPADKMQGLRGNYISMIFQEPMTSLNPVFRIGAQIDEVIALHEGEGKTKEDIKKRTIEMLEMRCV